LVRVLSQFLTSATDASRFPVATLPEVAFLGRSNVGKSSVINSLLGAKVAKTSSTPGRTRSINFFEVRWPGKPQPEVVFADLPGYGYAHVSREISSQWPSFIEPYLTDRATLALCLVLVDLNVPFQPSDQMMLDFLASHQRPFLIVGTKSDRLSGNQLRNSVHGFARQFSPLRIVPYSARSGAGQEELWKEIRAGITNYHGRAV
jgi:GTP-binding protein